MNYRHAFHAGNFADVMKHALLCRILLHLGRKEAPYRFIDTHAGIGLYDLGGDEASRTGEWRDGIGRLDEPLDEEAETLLAPYRHALAEVRARYGPSSYPGSPLVARELMRRQDRAILVEKHPEDAALLASTAQAARAGKVLPMDGWTALGSLVPPRERRGLVLVDPPYEELDELARGAGRLARAHRKWPTGILALWYPVKREREVEAALARFVEIAAPAPSTALRLELRLEPADDARLTGSGLLVVNPPWTLQGEAEILLGALAERLGRRRPSCRIEWLGGGAAPLGAGA
ncbi:23S rRNA (adenine(2030)-N(6))-methyltransferase RlmJ [Enterovirga sp.]|uniref:23S rRNA (adenine(2030)-N(6))-methyltransferase RlmJ n=1 Tax=Enterovirga sp. TaxID=2026350 RepID=UPI002607D32A|nr:23S rRNA (adenine(2030)-N(6))-methyltransferase RlmJ [Enterovirga sp.]MDB5589830.1 lactate dehydrogenase [Enterovirga sp.]